MKSLLTVVEIGVIMKQLADWCRTISAGAIILGVLNPAILGDLVLTRKALWNVGLPTLILCLICSVVAAKIELRLKKGG
jgi:hypothetical protein